MVIIRMYLYPGEDLFPRFIFGMFRAGVFTKINYHHYTSDINLVIGSDVFNAEQGL